GRAPAEPGARGAVAARRQSPRRLQGPAAHHPARPAARGPAGPRPGRLRSAGDPRRGGGPLAGALSRRAAVVRPGIPFARGGRPAARIVGGCCQGPARTRPRDAAPATGPARPPVPVVPAALAGCTAQAATAFAAGGLVDPSLNALVGGVLSAMSPIRCRFVLSLLLVGLTCAGIGLALPPSRAPAPAALLRFAPKPKEPATSKVPEKTYKHPDAVHSLVFANLGTNPRTQTERGHFLVTGDEKGLIRFWSVQAGKEAKRLPAHNKPVRALAFTPSGNQLASGDETGIVNGWDAVSRKQLMRIKLAGSVTSL